MESEELSLSYTRPTIIPDAFPLATRIQPTTTQPPANVVPRILLTGPPGCGKSQQSKYLSKAFPKSHLHQWTSLTCATPPPFSAASTSSYIVEDAIGDGSIFNHLPQHFFGLIVYLDVPDDVSVERMEKDNEEVLGADEPEPDGAFGGGGLSVSGRVMLPLVPLKSKSPEAVKSSSRERANTTGFANFELNIRQFCREYRNVYSGAKALYDTESTCFLSINGHGEEKSIHEFILPFLYATSYYQQALYKQSLSYFKEAANLAAAYNEMGGCVSALLGEGRALVKMKKYKQVRARRATTREERQGEGMAGSIHAVRSPPFPRPKTRRANTPSKRAEQTRVKARRLFFTSTYNF